MRRHRNENELREDINKHQSETKNPIKREINELKLKIKI
jgi:ferritin-like metal-binding protein YciE